MKFLIQEGHSVIPKSIHEERIITNGDLFDFKIKDEDIKKMRELNRNERATVLKSFCDMLHVKVSDYYEEGN